MRSWCDHDRNRWEGVSMLEKQGSETQVDRQTVKSKDRLKEKSRTCEFRVSVRETR